MATKPISQREAIRLRRRVEALETAPRNQRKAWSQEYFRGTEIARETLNSYEAVRTARKLRHAVVVVMDDDGAVARFMALPHFSEGI